MNINLKLPLICIVFIVLASHSFAEEKTNDGNYGRLFVHTEPENAKIRILNIKPKFYQGIKLGFGNYHLEASANGYRTKKWWVKLNSEKDKWIKVRLQEITHALRAEDWFQKAATFRRANEYESAIECYKRGLDLYPKSIFQLHLRAESYLRLADKLNQEDKVNEAIKNGLLAIKDYNKGLSIFKDDPNQKFPLLLLLAFRAGAYIEIADYYAHAGKHDQATSCYLQAKKDSERSLSISKMSEQHPPPDAYYARGAAYIGLKQYKLGIKDLNKVLQLTERADAANPDKVLFSGAVLLLMAGYNGFISAKPDDNLIAYPGMAAELDFKEGRYAEAINSANQAIAIDPEDAIAYRYRGRSNLKLKNYQQGYEDLRMAIKINPEDIEAFYELTIFNYEVLNNYEKAIEHSNRCIELKLTGDSEILIYFLRGHCFYILKNHRQAIDNFTKVIELLPTGPGAYWLRGKSYSAIGSHKESMKDIKIAARLGNREAKDYCISNGISY